MNFFSIDPNHDILILEVIFMKYRFAQSSDIPRIREIYAPFINTTVTFELKVPDETEMLHRMQTISQTYPWIVLEEEGVVQGYAYLSTFNPRTAYQHTADLSIYLTEEIKGKGYGRKLCEILFEIARIQNIHRIVSIITEENTSSKLFHEKIGFITQGTLEKVGYKHNRWLNVSFYTKSLIDPVEPKPLIPLSQIKEKAQELLDQFNQNTN